MQNSCISSYNSKMCEKKIVNLVVRVRAIRTYVQIVLRGHLWSSVVLGTQLILFYHFVYINTLHINTACVWWIWLIERIYKSFHSHTLSLAFVLCFSKIPNCNVSRFLSFFFFGKQKNEKWWFLFCFGSWLKLVDFEWNDCFFRIQNEMACQICPTFIQIGVWGHSDTQ